MILRIALLGAYSRLLDYLAPAQSSDPLLQPVVGARVLVPFRGTRKMGMIVAILDQSDCPPEKLRPIEMILDQQPLFSTQELTLLHFAAHYYHTSLAAVLDAALPAALKKIPKINALLTENIKTLKKIKTPTEKILKVQQIKNPDDLIVNQHQQQAIDAVIQHWNTFKIFLLHGVTGSGKTEVYIQLIAHALEQGKQALILVPEIGLTPQLVHRFETRFSVPITVYHSGITDKKRYQAFAAASSGQAAIMIGTRSATFMPLPHLGLLIIDEEHDGSFKQQEGFRYHARDLLIMRAKLAGCPIVLGTATPALESLHKAEQGRYQSLSLPMRAGIAEAPTIRLLDVRHQQLTGGLSAALITEMRARINRQEQVLLLLNRRGFSPVLMCLHCRWMARCSACDAYLSVHYQDPHLECHHCEQRQVIPTQCPECHKEPLQTVGLGTERLEAALNQFFPEAKVLRIDRDSTRKKGAFDDYLSQVHSGEAEILLGTQMIAKGHHFDNVTLVAILDIDQALFNSDFRSLEKMGQLITQVAGRSGRAHKPGQVLLQTQNPDHPHLKVLLEQGYSAFARVLLKERQALGLPPYSYQALIRAEAKHLDRALGFLKAIQKKAIDVRSTLSEAAHAKSFRITGPVPAPMEKRQDQYRGQLLLESTQRPILQKMLALLMPAIEAMPASTKLRWSVDVDPMDLY